MLLSRNYAPSPRLAPYVRSHYVFAAALPPSYELIDQLLAETAFLRILVQGDWAARMDDGSWEQFGLSPLMGSNSRPLTVRVRGPFLVIGVAFRPCGWQALFDHPAHEVADTVRPFSDHWGDAALRLAEKVVAHEGDDAAIVAAIEDAIVARLISRGELPALPAMAEFERIARYDSTTRVADAAALLGLSVRQFERQCHASFGHSPKTVLRRSRFLDMAQVMRGFGEPTPAHLAALRYADQSHRNREFRHFIGMTPGAFEKASTPLFTAGVKLRADGI